MLDAQSAPAHVFTMSTEATPFPTPRSATPAQFRRAAWPCVWLLALFVAGTSLPAAQFVIFDVTFTFTKDDADNSKPSKSHYYVKGAAINPERPRDWT